MEVTQKLKTELPYNQALSLLGIHLKKMKSLSQRGICTSMFIAVLVTVAKVWKQASVHRQING